MSTTPFLSDCVVLKSPERREGALYAFLCEKRCAARLVTTERGGLGGVRKSNTSIDVLTQPDVSALLTVSKPSVIRHMRAVHSKLSDDQFVPPSRSFVFNVFPFCSPTYHCGAI